jgi:TDG/mug DNA glycosylase family protein
MAEPVETLHDILPPGLRLVVCGTAAGTESAAAGHYYARSDNRFWATLKGTGLIPPDFEPTECLCDDGRRLRKHGIGLTDLVRNAAGTDKKVTITRRDVDRFKEKLQQYQPQIVAFNGKKAAKAFFGHKDEGIADQIRAIWEADPNPPGWDYLKQFAGAVAAFVVEQNGYRRIVRGKSEVSLKVGRPHWNVGKVFERVVP